MKVLMAGCDLTSKGGIASVVRCLHDEAERTGAVRYSLIKTTDYKHGTKVSNLFVFLRGLLRFAMLLPSADVVHLQASSHASFHRKFIMHLLARFWRKPTIWHLHASRFEEFYVGAAGLRRRMIDAAFRSSAAVLVLCELFRRQLATSYGLTNVAVLRNPIETAPGGVADDGGPAEPDNRAISVLFVGFYIPTKGVADLLQVIARCAGRDGNRFRFLFGGRGDQAREIAASRAQHGDVVVDLGWLDAQAKERAYRDADVFILPSYNEGMPIVILEAMAAGLPVVSTRIAGIPEQVIEGENGYLVEPGDIEGLDAALQKLAPDEERSRMGQRSRQLVAAFTSDSVFADLLQIYEKHRPSAAGSRRGPGQESESA